MQERAATRGGFSSLVRGEHLLAVIQDARTPRESGRLRLAGVAAGGGSVASQAAVGRTERRRAGLACRSCLQRPFRATSGPVFSLGSFPAPSPRPSQERCSTTYKSDGRSARGREVARRNLNHVLAGLGLHWPKTYLRLPELHKGIVNVAGALQGSREPDRWATVPSMARPVAGRVNRDRRMHRLSSALRHVYPDG